MEHVIGDKEIECSGNLNINMKHLVLDLESDTFCKNGCGSMATNDKSLEVDCSNCSFTYRKDEVNLCNEKCGQEYAQKLHDKAGNKKQCTTCSGTGKVSKTVTCGECTNGSNECTTCKGTGKIMHVACSGNGYTIENNNCGHEGANGPHYYCTEHGLNIEQYHLGN